MNKSKSIELSNIALLACKKLLSSKEYSEIHDYINKYNEWGLGMETLIDSLYEEKQYLEKEQFEKIKEAMVSMGLSESNRMEKLSHNVKNT